MDAGAEWQAYLADKTGQRTVPMIFIHEKFIGGTSFLHLTSSGSEARERRIRSDTEGEGTMEISS
jgi:glutaredoxin 3